MLATADRSGGGLGFIGASLMVNPRAALRIDITRVERPSRRARTVSLEDGTHAN